MDLPFEEDVIPNHIQPQEEKPSNVVGTGNAPSPIITYVSPQFVSSNIETSCGQNQLAFSFMKTGGSAPQPYGAALTSRPPLNSEINNKTNAEDSTNQTPAPLELEDKRLSEEVEKEARKLQNKIQNESEDIGTIGEEGDSCANFNGSSHSSRSSSRSSSSSSLVSRSRSLSSSRGSRESYDRSSGDGEHRKKTKVRGGRDAPRQSRSRSRSRSLSADSFAEWRANTQKKKISSIGLKRGRGDDAMSTVSGAGRGDHPKQSSGNDNNKNNNNNNIDDKRSGAACGGGNRSAVASGVVGNGGTVIYCKGIPSQQVTVDRGIPFGAQSEYLPPCDVPSILLDASAAQPSSSPSLDKIRALTSLIPSDESLCALHLSQCPLPILRRADGTVLPSTFTQSQPAFPKIEAIKKYFNNLGGFAVFVHPYVRQPSGGCFCLVEFETREEAIRAFLAAGLFARISSSPLRIGWGRLFTNKKAPPASASVRELGVHTRLYSEFVAQFTAEFMSKIKKEGGMIDSDETQKIAIATEETLAEAVDSPSNDAAHDQEHESGQKVEVCINDGDTANSTEAENSAPLSSGAVASPSSLNSDPHLVAHDEPNLYQLCLRYSNATWIDYQEKLRKQLAPRERTPPSAPPVRPSPAAVPAGGTAAVVAAQQSAVTDTSISASASVSSPSTSYLPTNFSKSSAVTSVSPTAPVATVAADAQKAHVAGPLALSRVHSRAHQSKEKPMVILREFGAPRILVEPAEHIRYNRTVLMITTAVDPLMNYEVLNGQGVYCDAPMYALPFDSEKSVYDAVSQFGDINGITFTPDRRSVFVNFAKPQSVIAAVSRARQANWLESGVRASALGHSTQGK